jgi:hypothetical protein
MASHGVAERYRGRMVVRARRDVRDVVVAMLEHWGYWERMGIYGAAVQRSMLGRIRDGGAGGGSPGPGLPPGLAIPSDVMLTDRMVAAMRDEHRAGEAYFRAIRARFVSSDKFDERTANRAILVLVEFFTSKYCKTV